MKIQNIDRVLLFCTRNDAELTLQQLESAYGIQPDGTNFYYGLVQQNVDTLKSSGSPFNPSHVAFFAGLLESLRASEADEKTLILGVEPSSPDDPYGFVDANVDLVKALAVGLHGFQQQAIASGKRLQIVIRYASEMNDDPVYGHQPEAFKASFAQVRGIVGAAAPGVLMSFSPAIRADLSVADIALYWPGDDLVDIIGGTWYVGNSSQQTQSIANMRSYFLNPLGVGKPFGLSEVGGCVSHTASAGVGNDVMLAAMLHELEALQIRGVEFKYATIFLASVWGTDATLKFLAG